VKTKIRFQRTNKQGQKLEQASGVFPASKRSERIERAKHRDGKKLPVLLTPDGDETSAEESHSSESQPQADAETPEERQTKELRISSKDAWAAIVDSDVSIEVRTSLHAPCPMSNLRLCISSVWPPIF
jgi:hypothetical protein